MGYLTLYLDSGASPPGSKDMFSRARNKLSRYLHFQDVRSHCNPFVCSSREEEKDMMPRNEVPIVHISPRNS
jgi:hypothetical protein